MNDLVSVIVPIYNVENYIVKCVESILSQDYRPLEIILIDDGSTDNSGRICDEYKAKNKEVKVIHKKNGGLSDARNCGLEAAMGSHICCIDSDDYIDEGYIRYLINLINRYDAEMSICNISYVDKGVVVNPVDQSIEYSASSRDIMKKMLDEEEVTDSACGKMYKKVLFDNVRYPVGRTQEDLATTYKLIGKCKTIAYGNAKSYYYVNRSDSITKCKFSDANYDIIWAFNGMKEYVLERYPELEESCFKRECSVHMRLLQKAAISNVNDDRIKRVRKRLQHMSIKCLNNKKAKASERIRFILIAYFPRLYLLCYNCLKKILIKKLQR